MSKCKYCDCDNLEWIQLKSGKWCLCDSEGKAHECNIPYEFYSHKIPPHKERDTVKNASEGMRKQFETRERWKLAKWCQICGYKKGFSHTGCWCSK